MDQSNSESRKIAPETVAQMAEMWTDVPLAEADRKPVVQMLNNLMSDMAKMRAMSVGAAEPATIYQPE